AWHERQRRRRRLAKADLCDALATLLQAGMNIEEALSSLSTSLTRTVAERTLAQRLRDALRGGQPLSEACALQPGWFDRFDVALLAAGQHAGDLVETLGTIATHHQRAGSIGQRLFIALAYPATLVIAGIAVLEFMSFQILPQLVALIVQAKKPAPWLTEQVMATGHLLAWSWPLFAVTALAAVWGIRALARRTAPDTRLGALLHGNLLARVRRRYRAANLAWALSRLRKAGMPLASAIGVVRDAVPDPALRHALDETIAAITRGEDFSAALARSGLLDQEFTQLLAIGERSGELTTVLERLAERSYRSADRTADRVAAILGPLAIVILAILIGLLVLACAMPLAQLGDLV
ncbi:MAG: type II secretion system F family protein, partial [Planctomycetes bacterium]|nr:type II secretion system F family protein [Planctomycetota bacterium]